VHFLNTQQSTWDEEFGSNERGLNTLYLTASICYTLFIVLHLYGVYKLRQQLSYLHPIVKLFAFVVCIEYVSIILYCVHFVKYGVDGIGIIWLTYLAACCDSVSRISFIFLLLLLAHGWTISNDTLKQRWVIGSTALIFFALQIALLSYEWASYDPQQTSVTGAASVLQLMVVGCYLLFGLYFLIVIFLISYRNEVIPPKRRLYLRLGLLFSPWLLGPPLVAIGVLLLDDWVRTKIVMTLQLCLTIVAYWILSFLFWPSRADEYFSINTPKIGDYQTEYDRL